MSVSYYLQIGIIGLGVAFIEWLFFRSRLRLSFAWVLVTPIGFLIGYVFAEQIGRSLPMSGIASAVPFAVWGAVLGFVQTLALRKSYKVLTWWVLGSTAGIVIPMALLQSNSSLLYSSNSPIVAIVMVGVIYSFCTGLAFQLMKRRY